jgi:hypothetical protein
MIIQVARNDVIYEEGEKKRSIWDLRIDKNELISFKVAVNEAAGTYGLTPSAAALRVINVISDYHKKGQLEHELCKLNLQKYAINEFCSSRSPVIMTLMKLKSRGISEERILQLNNILENNGYITSTYASTN